MVIILQLLVHLQLILGHILKFICGFPDRYIYTFCNIIFQLHYYAKKLHSKIQL